MAIKYTNINHGKTLQIMIFGLKICHLATLVSTKSIVCTYWAHFSQQSNLIEKSTEKNLFDQIALIRRRPNAPAQVSRVVFRLLEREIRLQRQMTQNRVAALIDRSID
jgi:hypothetical protein